MAVLTQRQVDYVRGAVHRIPYEGMFNFYLFQLLVSMPLYMGLRRHEMFRLEMGDVGLNSHYLTINGRDIPFHPEMKKLVRRYVSYRAVRVRAESYTQFLLSAEGQGHGHYRMSRERLDGCYAVLSDISRVKFSPLDLRETFIYKLAASGTPPPVIMGISGISHKAAMKYIGLASRTMTVDSWYTQAIQPRHVDKRKP
jgi:integrase